MMKKQLAIALTAALLTFPAAPGLVLADTATNSGAGAVTTTTTQTGTNGGSTSASSSASTTADASTTNIGTTTSTTSSAITAPVVDQNGQTVNPGVLPDSPWYWFQTLMEKVQLALTFDPVKKAELTEKQATEDLAEAQALIKKENTEEAEKALTRYNEKIDSAQAFLDQLKDPNSETAQKVQLALTKVNTNNMVVLGSLLEKLPPQAAQRLALNIVRSVEKAVAKADKMDKKNGQNTDGTTTDASQSASTTTTTSTPSTNDQTGTTDQAQLTKEAQQALQEFQVALGVKHTPNGYAYGYYKAKKDGEDQNDQGDQDDQMNNSNTNSSAASGQTVQQSPTQVQKQAQTQQQPPKLQPQVNQSGDDNEGKDHNEQEHKENKSDKEKGHR